MQELKAQPLSQTTTWHWRGVPSKAKAARQIQSLHRACLVRFRSSSKCSFHLSTTAPVWLNTTNQTSRAAAPLASQYTSSPIGLLLKLPSSLVSTSRFSGCCHGNHQWPSEEQISAVTSMRDTLNMAYLPCPQPPLRGGRFKSRQTDTSSRRTLTSCSAKWLGHQKRSVKLK